MPTVVICSSASFYQQVVIVRDQLAELGYKVIIPAVAEQMQQTSDYEVEHYKTWFVNAEDYHKKATLMRAHFQQVVEGDIVLVLNYEKNGQPNYIGANVLMEMALGFHFQKPIFLLNELPEVSSYIEEIKGMASIPLHGEIRNLANHLTTS